MENLDTVPGKLNDLSGRVGRLESGQAELIRSQADLVKSQRDQTDKLQIILDILTTTKTLSKFIKWAGGMGIGATILWNVVASHLPHLPGK